MNWNILLNFKIHAKLIILLYSAHYNLSIHQTFQELSNQIAAKSSKIR